MLHEYCGERGITYDECGTVLVALDETKQHAIGATERRRGRRQGTEATTVRQHRQRSTVSHQAGADDEHAGPSRDQDSGQRKPRGVRPPPAPPSPGLTGHGPGHHELPAPVMPTKQTPRR